MLCYLHICKMTIEKIEEQIGNMRIAPDSLAYGGGVGALLETCDRVDAFDIASLVVEYKGLKIMPL